MKKREKDIFLFFGDSTILGVGAVGNSWVDLAMHHLRACHYEEHLRDITYYNLGISDDDSVGVLQRIGAEVKSRYRESARMHVFIAVGLNDSRLEISRNDLLVPLLRFNQNIQEIIDITESIPVTTVTLITPLPVLEDMIEYPPAGSSGSTFRNDFADDYANDLRIIAEERGTLLFDLRREALAGSFVVEGNSYDGVHPNDMGYHAIAQCFSDFLERNFVA